MIPRIIHYCWYGKKKYSKEIKRCMDSWERHLPDYEFILWDEENTQFDIPYIIQAYKHKKFAFVSDYVRFWAVFNHGGIYLDTDMYLLKNFDILLNNKVFFGFENLKSEIISGGVFGSEKGNAMIRSIMDKYAISKFENSKKLNLMVPKFITEAYVNYHDKNAITIYPFDFFYPLPFRKKNDRKNFLTYKTENTYAIHLWSKSWFSLYDKFKRIPFKLKRRIKRIVNTLYLG
jgi:mannosyltransferase OCH1-like enzyme